MYSLINENKSVRLHLSARGATYTPHHLESTTYILTIINFNKRKGLHLSARGCTVALTKIKKDPEKAAKAMMLI